METTLRVLFISLAAFAPLISADSVEMKIVEEPSVLGFQHSFGNSYQLEEETLKLRVQPANFSGPTHFKRLFGRCFHTVISGYKYSFCPFSNITQHEQNVQWNAYKGVLGVWQEWEVKNNSFTAMLMKDGDACGDIYRSVKVIFTCGNHSKIVNATEPSRCNYEVLFTTPLVCAKDAMLVYPTLSPGLRHQWDLLEGDMSMGDLTQKGYNRRLSSIFEKAGIYLSKEDHKKMVKKEEEKVIQNSFEFTSLSNCNTAYRILKEHNNALKQRAKTGNLSVEDPQPRESNRLCGVLNSLNGKKSSFILLACERLKVVSDNASSLFYNHDIDDYEPDVKIKKGDKVRRRRTGSSYAISMCHWGAVVNYVIYETDGGTYNINNGPIFKALVLVIDYYQHQHCGLVRNLYMPCCEPSYNATSWEKYKRVYTMYGNLHLINEEYSDDELNEKSLPSPTKDSKKGSSIKREPISHSAQGRDSGMKCSDAVYDETDAGWTETEAENTYKPILRRTMTEEDALDLENTYTEIRPDVLNLPLRPEDVKLTEKLGSGQFGEVMKGTCMLGRTEVPVAVKTLKNQDPDGEKEIQSEANLMKKLDHKHIVRMIGICKGKTIMLVMELAELGPLNGYLNTQKVDRLKQWHLLEIAKQICDGMQYLESMDVVHRDLATRNVLLLNEHFAKISDFGMSRMVDSESDCYTSHVHGKWPLMWYAPECEKYRRFDSKSDVWSYGVTLWEIMSYGARPYPDMKIGEIRQFLDAGNRMAKPEDCDNRIYTDIMRACWEYEKTHRPSFKELLPLLERLFREFIHQNE